MPQEQGTMDQKNAERDFRALSPEAGVRLDAFRQAAARLEASESLRAFNRRARPKGGNLKEHLRTRAEMDAIRAFYAAREELTDVNPRLGAEIADRAEKALLPLARGGRNSG